MRIRPLEKRDIPRLKQLHAEGGVDYSFPDLMSPEFVEVHVLVNEDDQPVQAVAARRTVETFLLIDKQWGNPWLRWRWFCELHEAVRAMLAGKGYTDMHAWIAPQIERSFGRRLMKLGWSPSTWKVFACNTRRN